ncbi:ribonuclease H [Calocera viscosa TUFC12733]|uniref:Ribonuclease H n=1 Tax=Calocera viscosa (strain TUFC12733) TaxID=1330018 RepID=A0A167JRJ0_CALVF|nr:ribonuclease H [Calocera viscosa TUFC12733]
MREAGKENGAGEWTMVDRGKMKKQLKRQQRLEANPPVFKYMVPGLKSRRDPVLIDHVRDFTLSLLCDMPPQQWIVAENPRSITHVLALFIPGIQASDIGLSGPSPSAPAMPVELPRLPLPPPAETKLPILHTLFSHACRTRAPGEQYKMHSFIAQFLQIPLTGDEAKKRYEQRQEQQQSNLTPADLVLTYPQMKENDYPIPTYLRPQMRGMSSPAIPEPSTLLEPGWIETPQTMDTPAKYSLLAIDCEMCETAIGQELARISIIDAATSAKIYDTMVMPANPITDYQTRYSGVTEAKLKGVTTTVADVQQYLLTILHPDTILLGHSLENDLKVLKLCHPRCADTSVLYHHPRGGPYKPGLKWLAQRWMGKEIQKNDGKEGEQGGHDPEEDAKASLELFKLKLEKGTAFGEFQQDLESIFEKMGRPNGKRHSGATSVVVDHGHPAQWHGAKATTAVACTNDDEVVEGVVDTIPTHDFVFARMMDLSHSVGWTTTKNARQFPMSAVERASSPPNHPEASSDAVKKAFADLNDRLTRLHRSLPKSTAIILMTGHSDPRKIVQLNARKQNWEQQWRKTNDVMQIPKEEWWTSEDDRKLAAEVEKAKAGLGFFCITRHAPVVASTATT